MVEVLRNIVSSDKDKLINCVGLFEALQDMYLDATFGIHSQVFDTITMVAYVLEGDETTTDSEYKRRTLKIKQETKMDKIDIANGLLKELKIKALQIEDAEIKNIIFSLFNIETHYMTGDGWYCAKCYKVPPQNEDEVKEYCKDENLFRGLHDNDYKRSIKLVYYTDESIDELIGYLQKLKIKKGKK